MNRVREQIGMNSIEKYRLTGDGICVAVLDSGISHHPDLKGRVLAFRDFSKKQNDRNYYDDFGHGTQA